MTGNEYAANGIFAAEYPLPFLIYAFCIGVLLGLLLDILTVCDRLFGKNSIILFFTDFFSVLSTYLLLFAGALFFNNGILRWYHVAMFLCGNRMYSATLSFFVLQLVGKIYFLVSRTLNLLFFALMLPVKKISDLIVRIYRNLANRMLAFVSAIRYRNRKRIFRKHASGGFDLYKCEPELKKYRKENK